MTQIFKVKIAIYFMFKTKKPKSVKILVFIRWFTEGKMVCRLALMGVARSKTDSRNMDSKNARAIRFQ